VTNHSNFPAPAFLVGTILLACQAPALLAQAPAPKKESTKPVSVQTEEEVFRLLLRLAPVPLPHGRPISSLTFSPDGRKIITVSNVEGRVFHWDAATGKLLRQVRLPLGGLDRSAVSKDGRLLAAVDHASKVSVWDTVTGKKVSTLAKASGLGMALSPDGKSILAATATGQLGVWDAATGKQRLVLAKSSAWSRDQAAAFSPDGKLIAASHLYGSIGVWEAASGKEMRPIQADLRNPKLLAFTPDSTRLAACAGTGPVRFWKVATAREGPQLVLPPGHRLSAGQFGPDGLTLLTGGADGTLRLWELATGAERHRFPECEGGIACATFARDGQTMAVAGDDHLALVREVSAKSRPGSLAPVPVDPRDVPGLWAALASPDGSRAYRAIAALAARPADALPYLKERLKPAVPLKRELVAGLLKDLNSPAYVTREKATRALALLHDAVEPDLEKVLQDNPGLEVKRRVEGLLKKLQQPNRDPERRQALRGLEVLELVGTVDARELLRTIAAGAPQAELTSNAAAALMRLKDRSTRTP
jgi:WD40 repeat protein